MVTRLGPYEIVAAVGAGGMGEVYQARDSRLGRTVAIKVLPQEVAADPDRRRRFEQEARAVSALNHPHICTLYDVGRDGGVDFLVMEFLDGQTLAERLHQGRLPLAQALEYGAQIADALSAAHHHGIVHRDLKPANIVLTKNGAKLLDFGLAKFRPVALPVATAATAAQPAVTVPGIVLGTVPYMAPEQLEGKAADARTDLFAFGCVLYEMLTGRRAVDESVRQAVTPAALGRLLDRCLQKAPDDRPESARDVAAELEGISADVASSSVSTRSAPPQSKRRLVLASGVVIFMAVAGIWLTSERVWRPPAPAHFSLTMPGRTVFACSASPCLAAARDGSGVIFQGREGGQMTLYWHDLKGSGAWRIAGRASSPFLSPDSRWLGFVRDGKLWKLPLQNGRAMESTPATEICAVGGVRGATWGEDGTIVFAKTLGGLWRVSADGNEPRQITQVDSSRFESSHRFPTFLPGGHDVLFQVQSVSTTRQERSAIAVLSLASGRWRRIFEGGTFPRYLTTGHLLFARYGSVFAVPLNIKSLTVGGMPVPVLTNIWFWPLADNVAFDVAGDGTIAYVHQIHELPRNALVRAGSTGQVETVLPDRAAYSPNDLAISPDGQRLALSVDADDNRGGIWIYHLKEGRGERLTDGAFPVWSPTGDRVAFISDRSGPINMYVMPVRGGGSAERLTNSPNQQWPESWSPDGQYLAYQEQDANMAPGAANINTWILPLNGGAKPWLLEEGAVLPVFSPDGRWLAYTTGTDLYVRPFPEPGPRRLVSGTDGGISPVWSKNGPTLFYAQRPGDTRITARRVVSLAPFRLAEPYVAFALPFALTPVQTNIARLFAVTPDGRQLITVRPDERLAPEINTLQVIRNWPEEVKAALRAPR